VNDVTKYLDERDIAYKLFTHPPVDTVEAAQQHCSHIPGLHCKNLFFRDPKGRNHLLVVLPNTKPLDIKYLGQITGYGRLSFASERRMMKYLGLEPGSVSPFGLINDRQSEVVVFLDEEVCNAPLVTFHPNDNRATLLMEKEMFDRFLTSVRNRIEVIRI